MNITEFIEKHVGTNRVFEERFNALAVKEALGTITKEELAQLEEMDNKRDSQVRNEMSSDNLKQFTIKLLEMMNGNARNDDLEETINKALEEIRK